MANEQELEGWVTVYVVPAITIVPERAVVPVFDATV
jgi:hypothetical protein